MNPDDPDTDDRSFVDSPTLRGLLTRLRGGDADDPEMRARLDAAFSKHAARLHHVVARELRGFPVQQVEETVQDVLLIAWHKLPTHDGRHFRAWLFAIATRVCANVRRKRREVLSEDGLFDPGSEWDAVYARLRREERERLLLEAARACLEPKDQEVVYMAYELELPHEEIARLAGFDDKDRVRVTLLRCKRRLGPAVEALLREWGHGTSLLRPDEERA